jgi:hypothetical protein
MPGLGHFAASGTGLVAALLIIPLLMKTLSRQLAGKKSKRLYFYTFTSYEAMLFLTTGHIRTAGLTRAIKRGYYRPWRPHIGISTALLREATSGGTSI